MADADSNSPELTFGEDGKPEDKGTDPAKSEQSEGTTGQAESADAKPKDSTAEASEEEAAATELPKDGETEDEEGEEKSFFDPKEIPEDLPEDQRKRILATWKQMQAAYTRKTQRIAEQARLKPAADRPAEQADAKPPTVDEVEAEVLASLNIKADQLTADQRNNLRFLITLADRVADRKARETVAPLQEREVAREVEAWKQAHPDAKPYFPKMAALDRRTKQTLTLDELYDLASKQDRESKARNDRSDRARQRSQQNSESTDSTAAGAPPSSDPFDQMLASSRPKSLPF